MKTDFVRARIDAGLKADTEAIFQRLGLTATSAITLFYNQVQLNQGLPFEVKLPSASTRKAMAEAASGDVDAFESKDALFAALRGDRKCSSRKQQNSSGKTTKE